jgi:hypothetical protein
MSEVRGFLSFEPRTSDRAFPAYLARHGPWTLADCFSILLEDNLDISAFDLHFVGLH